MDPLADKQIRIADRKAALATGYPCLWQSMLSEWGRPDEEASDRAWLLYSANYLFRTGGVRWVLDPLTLQRRLPSAPGVDTSALAALDYIVLTHRHADHLDPALLSQLKAFPARWILPEFLLDQLRPLTLPAEKIILAHPGEPLSLGNLALTPFNGLHWEADPGYPENRRGVPALGYLAEFNGKRWLLPGDTRTYDASQLPGFGAVDGLFAHLWLGRGQALQAQPHLLDDFCRFCQELQPGRIIITHLEEVGRLPQEYWDMDHLEQVRQHLLALKPELSVEPARVGESVCL